MLDYTLLTLFIPTFLLISATPGLCMTLALSLGMSIGVRKTFWMMWGELTGVAVLTVLSVIGVASIMLNYPTAFTLFKYMGGAYLIYIGTQQWLMRGKMKLQSTESGAQDGNLQPADVIDNKKLILQGFVTAIANPKGWAFMVSLLPSFINPALDLTPQLLALLMIIISIEFMFLSLYATGGKSLGRLLGKSNNVRLLNRISGSVMILIGVWLALS